MNRDFLNLIPVSNSELWCATCEHVVDDELRICKCGEPNKVNFKQWVKEKKEKEGNK
jgi:hypothetical protein